MRALVFLLAALTAGCATAEQRIHRGFTVVERGLKGVDVGMDVAGSAYAAAYATAEAACREKLGDDSTSEQREECTKAFANADEIAKLTKQASDLYDTAVEILDDLEKMTIEIAKQVEKVQ